MTGNSIIVFTLLNYFQFIGKSINRHISIKEYYSEYLPNDKYAIIKPAVERIHREYTKGLINISELSDMCGITPEYFRKIFKAYCGVSPLKYINALKITHAKELLDSGMYSVTEAALRSGIPI